LGIGCNEYTAVCIGEDGFAHCYGEYPQYQEQVYFLRPTCLDVPAPFCQTGTPLDWGFEGGALNVYVVDATEQGNRGIDLNDWSTGVGGEWENWWVEDGELMMSEMSEEPQCSVSSVNSVIDLAAVEMEFIEIINSSGGYISIRLPISSSITILDMSGRVVQNLGEMSAGEHLVRWMDSSGCFIVSSNNKDLQSVVFCD